MGTSDMDEKSWHLDKKVPVALIFTIATQSAATIWWASHMGANVETLQNRQNRQEAIIETMRSRSTELAVQLGRIEEASNATLAMVERLISKIDRQSRSQ